MAELTEDLAGLPTLGADFEGTYILSSFGYNRAMPNANATGVYAALAAPAVAPPPPAQEAKFENPPTVANSIADMSLGVSGPLIMRVETPQNHPIFNPQTAPERKPLSPYAGLSQQPATSPSPV